MSSMYPNAIAYDPRILTPLEWEAGDAMQIDYCDDFAHTIADDMYADRAEAALASLLADNMGDIYSAVVDMLTDLRNLCAREGININDAIDRSTHHFLDQQYA